MSDADGAEPVTEDAESAPEAPNMVRAVENMLEALPYDARHDALVRLARYYAVAIDEGDPETLSKLGPRLESVCVRLGVRPVAVGGGQSGRTSQLDAWRARRAN